MHGGTMFAGSRDRRRGSGGFKMRYGLSGMNGKFAWVGPYRLHPAARRLSGAAALLAGAAAVWSAPAEAQVVPIPAPPGFEQGLGLELGGFEFHTRLQAGIGATSNARKDPTEESDHLRVLQGDVRAQSTWKRHSLSATASHVDKRTFDIDQDTWATSGGVNGRLDLWEDWSVNASLSHEEDIVEKHHPAQFIGNLNGRTETDALLLGVKREDADSLVTLTWRYQDVENETEIDTALFQSLQINDRKEQDLTLQAGPKYAWGKAYVQLGAQRINYTPPAGTVQPDQDSEGVSGGLGVAYQQGKLGALAQVLGFHQDYETNTIGEVSGVTAKAELVWQARDDLAFGGVLERRFDEQATPGSAGLFTNLAAVGVQYQPIDTVYLKLEPSYRYFREQGVGDSAQSVQLNATAAWQVHERVEFLLTGDLSRQTANDAALNNLEFDDATVTLSTVVTF